MVGMGSAVGRFAALPRGGRIALALIGLVMPATAGAAVEVLTQADNPTIAADTLVVRLTGPILPPIAESLAEAWRTHEGHGRLLLDLDSPGGSLDEAEALVGVLAVIRAEARVDTLVRHGALCASSCIAVFVQGADRAAGGASAWLFHGACRDPASNVPSLALTHRYLEILRAAGVDEAFLCRLVTEGYVTSPGQFWLSGYELFHVYRAGIITRLLEPWRPEPPRVAPPPPLQPR